MKEQPSRGRILIIDDHASTRYVFRRILSHGGYEVHEAETGQEGLAKATLPPDLIIADVNLPDMLGYDVCRRLKSNPLTENIPVLQISASFISDESMVQALGGGADSFLTQPVQPPVLLASVNALLRLRKAEVSSQHSALQWQSTFDSLNDGLVLADADGTVLRTNASFVQMLGTVASAAEGLPLTQLFTSWLGFNFEELRPQLMNGGSIELSRDNQWLRIRYDQIQSDPQLPGGSVLIVTDITDHKKLQETLKLSERLAATGRLAHIIAHEINNPLEAMSNLLYLAAQESKTSPQLQSYIEQASSELVRISQITKQVLTYHRQSKRPEPSNPIEIIASVLAMFRAQIGSMGVELITSFKCADEINVQAGEIRQVLNNILANSLEAIAPRSGVLRVRCFRARDLRTNQYGIRFLFSDNGAGIPPEHLAHIFEAFYTTKAIRGSGIGLWLTAEMIKKHHGRVRVRTRTRGEYRGTLFDIFLPSQMLLNSS